MNRAMPSRGGHVGQAQCWSKDFSELSFSVHLTFWAERTPEDESALPPRGVLESETAHGYSGKELVVL